MQRLISICLLGLIILLTIYAPIELTRVILLWVKMEYWTPGHYFEIPFIWACYIVAIVLIGLRGKRD